MIPFKSPKVPDYLTGVPVFNPLECTQIIQLFDSSPKIQTAQIGNKEYVGEIRRSDIVWLEENEKSGWVYDKIQDAILKANDDAWRFAIHTMELIQLTKYEGDNMGHYAKHIDTVHKRGSMRKVSIVVQLSPENSYEEGNLKLFLGKEPILADRKVGTATIFPSYLLHEASLVTEGTRYSLVCWANGPAFK